ncbi:MAG: putative Ig domain-containing protein [Acidobacteria bacterium]|nr:putative Ig domain-containing protein [Acidobacteriota bacterium]
MNRIILICALCVAGLSVQLPFGTAAATIYEVGPGKPYANINDVPWESIGPGDTVLIHWRSAPYREKWVICRQGTAEAPITVRGVASPEGLLPVIDGNGASTRPALNFWNQNRALIKIGGASNPPDTLPRYITIENLDLRSARPPYSFTTHTGAVQNYVNNAASIYIEKGEYIIIRNCILRDSGNGLFIASSNSVVSREILIEGNHIYDNGNVDSLYEHNTYTAALGITYQYNRFGPLRAGALGNNLKDRSAGLVVRYNWIEGGNRQLDLVDGEDSSIIRSSPNYRSTFAYGNILIEPAGAGNRQIAHYGGDSGVTGNYRKGIFYFHGNTIVSTRTDRTTIVRLSTNEEACDFRNNIVYVTAGGNTLSLVDSAGVMNLSHNWFKPGRVATFGTLTGVINDDGTSVTGSNPGFANEAGQDFRLSAGSACINAGTGLAAAAIPFHVPVRHYIRHQMSEARPDDGVVDIGAYEYGSAAPPPPPPPAALEITTASLPKAVRSKAYSHTLQAEGGVKPYNWSINSGALPPGLTLRTDGVIEGVPTRIGTAKFTVRVRDAQNPAASDLRELTLQVANK